MRSNSDQKNNYLLFLKGYRHFYVTKTVNSRNIAKRQQEHK